MAPTTSRDHRHALVLEERFALRQALKTTIQVVAEGVSANSEQISRLDAKVDQLAVDMKMEFSDVRSMIKFSYAELDRRIRTLDVVASLQSRVERLESTQ